MKKVTVRKIGLKRWEYQRLHGAFITQAISQPDSKGKGNVAMPNDNNVSDARDFIIENKK